MGGGGWGQARILYLAYCLIYGPAKNPASPGARDSRFALDPRALLLRLVLRAWAPCSRSRLSLETLAAPCHMCHMHMQMFLKVAWDVSLRLCQIRQTYEDRKPRAPHSCLVARVLVAMGCLLLQASYDYAHFFKSFPWSDSTTMVTFTDMQI